MTIFSIYRHPVAEKRINACIVAKMLQKSDRTLLPGTMLSRDDEELSTILGDPLNTSTHLYQSLQDTYQSDEV